MPAVSNSPPESSFPYGPGDVIAGKYALEAVLGEGGMGAVFRARNIGIDMPVAIKLIRGDLNRELLSGRLLQEARAAAKLAHPAIVRVFDVGQTEQGDPFIVMELLHGESLAAVIERDGRLSSLRAVQLLLPIADALSAAHAKGFVHRDVKPDNIFIVQDEGAMQPKLFDFGIVKLEQCDGNSQLTQLGAVLGSPEYMSPEQARGLEDIDLRSDVWSFGAMLYEAVSGSTPFESKNYNALLRMIVETDAPTLHAQQAADEELSAIVAQALNREPSARWQSMSQMGRALAAWLSSHGVTEDVCGVSLEAKWLVRNSDPNAFLAPGFSNTSFPDGWGTEPPSGIRATNLGTAATVRLPKTTETAVSMAPFASLGPSGKRVYMTLAGSLLVAAGALAWLGLRSSEEPARAAVASPTQTPPTEARPEAFGAAAPVASQNPAAPVVAAATADAGVAKRASPVKQRTPARAGVVKPRATPPSDSSSKPSDSPSKPRPEPTPDPADDLIAPY